jgi:hypothetical protein
MKRWLAIAAVLALSTISAQAADIIKYDVKGTNLDGSKYGGTAELTIKTDTTCTIEWQTGSTTSNGICMRNDDSVAAAYQLGDDVGLVIYKLEKDGTLDGLWTIAGQNGNGTEVLTPTN